MGSIEHYCSTVHGAGNLVNYVFNCIAISDYSAFIDVATNKNHLFNNWAESLVSGDLH